MLRIVCIGDSHTFGVGTSAQYSYPAQLERLFNLNNNNIKFSVVNLGVPGSSTRTQTAELENFFHTDRADIVLLLTGRNNDSEISQIKEGPFLLYLKKLKAIRFFSVLLRLPPDSNLENYNSPYRKDYLELYLDETRKLCNKNGAVLILLSYYNGFDKIVKDFSERNNILFLDFSKDFASIFEAENLTRILSPDMSHLNRFGYRFFSERLYSGLFNNQGKLRVKLGPLLKRIEDKEFYAQTKDKDYALSLQKIRVRQKSNTKDYSYELIHLGHIYSEISELNSARDCYLEGLVYSGYADDNTITHPIIDWYLKNKGQKEAISVCEGILAHNPGNRIAKIYLNRLKN